MSALNAPKWAFKFLVVAPQGITTFRYKDTAWAFARATHGTLWPIESVADYSTLPGRNFVATKDGHVPIAVD